MKSNAKPRYTDAQVISLFLARSAPLALVLGGLLILAFAFINVYLASATWHSSTRLAVTFAYYHGYEFYYPATSGPILNTIYPPLAYLVFLPAVLGWDPVQALIIGTVIAVILYFIPVLFLLQSLRRQQLHFDLPLLLTLYIFCFFSFQIYGLYYSAFSIHADAPALGFSAMASGCLMLTTPPRSARLHFLSAAACCMALLSKQTTLPLPIVLFLFLWITESAKIAARFAAMFLIQMAGLILFLSFFMDMPALAFNVLTVPGLHPWYKGKNFIAVLNGLWCFFQTAQPLLFAVAFVLLDLEHDPRKAILRHLTLAALAGSVIFALYQDVIQYTGCALLEEGTLRQYFAAAPLLTVFNMVWLLFVHIMGVILLLRLATKLRKRGFNVSCLREKLKREPHLLFLMLAVSELPFSIMGYSKVGGIYNSFSMCAYPLLIFLCITFYYKCGDNWAVSWRGGAWTAALVIVFLLSLARLDQQRYYHFRNALVIHPCQNDYEYIQKHGDSTYFPWDPLAALMAEGRLYHYAYGVFDLELAGHLPPENNMRAYFPPGIKAIAVPISVETFRGTEIIFNYMQGWTPAPADLELPGNNIYIIRPKDQNPGKIMTRRYTGESSQ